jgi:hypothetical protein
MQPRNPARRTSAGFFKASQALTTSPTSTRMRPSTTLSTTLHEQLREKSHVRHNH